ncbi:Salutaridinol 7-O-acetyltransferase protein [Dioscorea alata]|uniref:Salutaridinol 7-O-acetyltransferase protein n=1 Tax=Dioscorea alata TaxID=55571 RepID=A0ACB7W9S5_DIOAL|nr:Salutaridinol 7-O-acetyltransferase protein [Dioscorea alata]
MMLQVEIKSKETIKPSSPTPLNHPPIQLSSLDHTSPHVYAHILLFYSTTINPNHLKTSLSTTLLHFSPLAGRIHRSSSDDTLYVHCTDDGAVFIEAEAHQAFNLQHASSSSSIDDLRKLLPIKKEHFNILSEDHLLAVQLTVFDSGGHVLGLSMSHLIADGASMAIFLKHWSSISRSGASATILNGSLPNFHSASLLFSPSEPFPETVQLVKSSSDGGEVAIRRFMIDKDGVERLRISKQGWRPTRVEAVNGLFWRCLRRANASMGDGHVVSQVVNLRRRMGSKLSINESFGNLWVGVNVVSSECERVEEALREAVTSVDEEYVKKLIEGKMKKRSACWIFNSWCRMGFYESSDFGSGEAIWVACGNRDVKNASLLIDAKDGEGVEVWVWLDVDEMEKLERDIELLDFVSHVGK